MTIADINRRRQLMGAYGPAAKDRAREELLEIRRHAAAMERGPIRRVMISDKTGKTDDIKTGLPPVMKKEVREAWERAREEASIERLFK